MKILFIATVDIHIQSFHLKTIKSLKEQGNTIDLASHGDFTNSDISHKYNLEFSRNPLSINNLFAFSKLRKILKNGKYDIISCHTPISSFFARLASYNIPDLKVIYTAHGFHFYQGAPLINQLIYHNMERLAAHFTDILVTINQEDYIAAKEFKLRKNGEVRYIPGVGIDYNLIINTEIDRMQKRKELGLPTDAKIILSIGELIPRKNHLFVINSLEKNLNENPQLHYIICGQGVMLDEITNRLTSLGLSKQIHLLGYRKDVIEIIKASDIFVFPSIHEGLPVAVMEAMACGIPIILSDIRGNHDLIENQKNGLLYKTNQQDDFDSCIKQILEDNDFANEIARQAVVDAKKYSIEVVQKQILDLY